MKRIVKLECIILCILFVLSLCSCRNINFDDSKEQKAYKEVVTTFFNALDNRDEDAIYKLFSPAVREQADDIKEQISHLMSVYEGPTSDIGYDELLTGEYSNEYGDKVSKVSNTIPFRSDDSYYWCYIELMYENDSDPKQIGVTKIDFYIEDDYFFKCYIEDDPKIYNSVGIQVHANVIAEDYIRCINGTPYSFSTTEPVKIDDVNDFLKNSTSFEKFKTRFGEPNAESTMVYYYELPKEKGKRRYIELHTEGDEICCASLVDDFKFIEYIYDDDCH